MDVIVAALITVFGPTLIVLARLWWKRWRKRHDRREMAYEHQKILAESLLEVTLRVEDQEDRIGRLDKLFGYLWRRPDPKD